MRGRSFMGAWATLCHGAIAALALSGQAFAQNAQPEQAPPLLRPDGGHLNLDILGLPEATQADDPAAAEQCAQDQDAALIANQIIVCRRVDGPDAPGFDKADWARRYAERTQGSQPVDVAGAGGTIMLPGEGSVISVTIAVKQGPPPDPALLIDFAALPEAPPDSEADRVARGLPPMGPQ